LNYQRKIIYNKRRAVLLGDTNEMLEILSKMIGDDGETRENIENKKIKIGEDNFSLGVKSLMLQTVDMFWMDHLEMMDYLRGSVNLRAYGQRDPLVEYKREGLRLFKDMERSIEDLVVETISKTDASIKTEETPKVVEGREADVNTNSNQSVSQEPINKSSEVGRNDVCPCGSGKKYKKCHGK
jgi:preprotein translocase subunit SecA